MAKKKIEVSKEIQAVGFYIGSDEYAVDIAHVSEIGAMMEIRKIPKSPPFVEGVVNLRGAIIPIIDLRKRFDQPAESKTSAKIIIVEFGGHQFGMIVDNVSEVIKMKADAIEPPPPMFSSNIDSAYVQGVGKLDNRLIILLDLQKLLSSEEQQALVGLKNR